MRPLYLIVPAILLAAAPLARAADINHPGGSMSTGARTTAGTGADWTMQDNYWRESYRDRPYYNPSMNYDAYQPAYRYGVDMYNRSGGRPFNELNQSELQSGWNRARGNSSLSWTQAQQATRDAYDRMYDNRASASATTDTGSVGSTTGSAMGTASGSVMSASPSAGGSGTSTGSGMSGSGSGASR